MVCLVDSLVDADYVGEVIWKNGNPKVNWNM